MFKEKLELSLKKLRDYIEKENFIGYDPYDTLLSWIPFKAIGKWPSAIATQLQKRNPINIRPILGIRKEINPKAFGLFLLAYSKLYNITKDKEYLEKANYFFDWLKLNYSKGYSGYAWGYNFPWANPQNHLDSFVPSSVVTGFVCRGMYEYYKVTDNVEAKKILISASAFIINDIPFHEDENGICYSYIPLEKDLCYNSSLLAAEILARTYNLTNNETYKYKAINAVEWVLSKQKQDGRWNYSQDLLTGVEREQIDFHQGYVLESIIEIKSLLEIKKSQWDAAITRGLTFYKNAQFLTNGISLWRFPKKYPIEIHNQAQGIITFSKSSNYLENSFEFSSVILNWTIKNMQANDGYFYYQIKKFHKNKISYMRWSNAWMFLSFVTYFEQNAEN